MKVNVIQLYNTVKPQFFEPMFLVPTDNSNQKLLPLSPSNTRTYKRSRRKVHISPLSLKEKKRFDYMDTKTNNNNNNNNNNDDDDDDDDDNNNNLILKGCNKAATGIASF